ncbi:MAG TPA: ABC transporter substrate-binding protein, partial [Candidatus Acidoferrum sp.]|nr:ABC transporter substrate-binding protein [Candidatus Acidoferrum sp.]
MAAWTLLLASPAHARKKPPVVAYIGTGRQQSTAIFLDAFKEGMRDNGLLEGRDYSLEVRWAEDHYERFPALAAELVRGKPAVIIVATIASARAAQQATRSIPIVMTGLNDPVGEGLVASLARPGGNITGLSSMAEDVTDKLMEILHTAVPKAKSVAVLFNPANP